MQGFYLPSLRLLGVLFLAACSLTAQAATDETDHSATFEKNQQSYVINADGSFVQTIELVTRINEERAIKSNAQRSLATTVLWKPSKCLKPSPVNPTAAR